MTNLTSNEAQILEAAKSTKRAKVSLKTLSKLTGAEISHLREIIRSLQRKHLVLMNFTKDGSWSTITLL